MRKVAETHHLQKRGSTWHYYRRVPTALVPIVGKTFVKKSLGTADLKAAKVLRNALNVKVDAEFAAAETAGAPDAEIRPASLAMLTEHLRQHIEALDERSAEQMAADPPADEGERADLKREVQTDLQMLARGDPNGEVWIDQTGNKVVKASGASLDDKEIVAGFAEVVRRGLIELQNRKLDRLDDRYGVDHHDPLFASSRPPSITFGELADIFLQERLTDYEANGIGAKRSDKIRAELDFLREAIGVATKVVPLLRTVWRLGYA